MFSILRHWWVVILDWRITKNLYSTGMCFSNFDVFVNHLERLLIQFSMSGFGTRARILHFQRTTWQCYWFRHHLTSKCACDIWAEPWRLRIDCRYKLDPGGENDAINHKGIKTWRYLGNCKTFSLCCKQFTQKSRRQTWRGICWNGIVLYLFYVLNFSSLQYVCTQITTSN